MNKVDRDFCMSQKDAIMQHILLLNGIIGKFVLE